LDKKERLDSTLHYQTELKQPAMLSNLCCNIYDHESGSMFKLYDPIQQIVYRFGYAISSNEIP